MGKNKTIHRAIKFSGPANYKIIVQGVLGEKFLKSYNGVKVITEKGEDGNYLTTLFVCIRDQVELSGILNALHDWRFPIVLVECERDAPEYS